MMKILKINYFEKFNINPINITDLNSLDFGKYHKSDLKTYDIIQMHGIKYMVFLKNDFSTVSNCYNNLPDTEEGIFFYYMKSTLYKTHYMKIKDYDDNLKYIPEQNVSWNVTDVWTYQTHLYKMYVMEAICQEYMNDIIEKYNYKHIHIS